jgi:hypothetical protein
MRRVARVTEDLGRDSGGFYIEAPGIPEGLTCAEWRRGRAELRASVLNEAQPSRPEAGRVELSRRRRSALPGGPVLRPAT